MAMTPGLRACSLGLLIAGAAALAACKPRPSQTAARDEILIGATLPLTGAEARVGGFFKEGYELAFDEVTAAGGLEVAGKKRPVKLQLHDDTSNQATAVSLADKLINSDKVDFLLGTYSTSLVEAQTTVAEQNKVPYVNGGGAASEIYKRGYKYIFGALSPVELLGTTLMGWIAAEQQAGKLPRPAKIALLWENTAHGKDFRTGVSEFVTRSGGAFEIAVDESFEVNGKDFSALLGKVKSAGADLFLADAHLPDYITLHKQYLDAGLCHKVVSYGARGSEQQAIDTLGKDSVAYVVSGVWWSALLADKIPAAKKFTEAFKAKYGGRTPEWFQALGYEAAHALFTAIQQAGSTDREAVRAKLAALKIDSLLPGGTLEFPADKGGDAQNGFVLQQNLPDGTSPIILPKAVATADGIAPNPRCAP
ncbi:MAG TPA: amino acid ABC transporter substrate-binding protein [Kofleriaceae bacterium]|jgi:branched-chain amino acid transport system substrate-binding protein|nr:amino acid ABC transporter substrate-binding protein [Kofleriaceae bacterium]